MSNYIYPEILAADSGVAGTLFNTYTTAKTVLPAGGIPNGNTPTMVPGFWTINRKIRWTLWGAISNIVTTPGTLTLQFMLGSIAAFSSGALQLSSTAHTQAPFKAEFMGTCRAVGSGTSANIMGQWLVTSQAISATAVADSTTSHNSLLGPATAPAVGTGFDSTVATIMDFWAGFSISNAGNGIQIQQHLLESWT